MQELVDMLEKQLACLNELAGLVEKQQKALKSVRSSAEAGSIAAAMEKPLLRLADIQEAEDAFVSQQGGSNVPVDYTSVKYVKKPAGARPGMVVYETCRTLYVTPDEETIRRLDRKNK